MMVPDKFSDNIEAWRKWEDDVSKYFDEGQEGIKAIMDEVAKSTIVVVVHELYSAGMLNFSLVFTE